MKIKKILKILGIIMAILIVLVLIHTIRNYIIITDLQNKILQYSDSSNCYIKSVATEDNGNIIISEHYKKDNRQVAFLEKNMDGEISKVSVYDNGKRTDMFWEDKDDKIAQLDSGTIVINICNGLETTSKWQTFFSCIISSIKSVNYNGKDCYVINGFMSLTSFDGEELYIEKDTGLQVKSVIEGTSTEKEYKFDGVDDSVFVEPDISQYVLKEKE